MKTSTSKKSPSKKLLGKHVIYMGDIANLEWTGKKHLVHAVKGSIGRVVGVEGEYAIVAFQHASVASDVRISDLVDMNGAALA